MGRSVIRLVANRLVHGYRSDPYVDSAVMVMAGTEGSLLTEEPSGYTVEWDRAFLQDQESADGSLVRRGRTVVFTPASESIATVTAPFSVKHVIDLTEDEEEQDRFTIGPDSPEPIRTTGPQLAQFACDVMDAVNRLRDSVEPTAQVDEDPLPGADIDEIVASQYDEDEELDGDKAARLLVAAADSMQRFAETFGVLARQIARLAGEGSDAE